jgi:dTDP-4-dehydrorhamnose 3,5-epimerase
MGFNYKIIKTKIPGILVIKNSFFRDKRGIIFTSSNSFIEKTIGLNRFHNHHTKIMKRKKNSLTGMHGDKKSWKLLSCLAGSIKVVLIDLREKSKTYNKVLKIRLNDKDLRTLVIPPNVALGYLCKKILNIVLYRIFHNGIYLDYKKQFTIYWNDPKYKINWGINKPIISKRDNPNIKKI